VGGTVVGLGAATTVVLRNNGGDDLTVSVNGSFTFATPLSAFASYAVTVFTQPANGQVCTVTNSSGSGTVVANNIDTVRVSCATVFTTAGSGLPGLGDAPGEEAVFWGTSGIATDAAGNLYVADYFNNVVRKITPAGAVSTLAGSGLPGYAEGTGTAASFHFAGVGTSVAGAAVDAAGSNIYVADTINHAIRKITSAGVVTTLAGSGTPGFVNGTGNAASFNNPQGVAVDAGGNVYVADSGNHAIRKIDSGGAVTTLAGSGTPGFNNATGVAAQFNSPQGVVVDGTGNVYVGDAGNGRIRKITPAGAVTTFAGAGGSGYKDATGAAAIFNSPQSLALDGSGNLYVADSGNNVVRMITQAGVVSTLAGASSFAFADGPVTTARFNLLHGLAVDGSGNVIVADWGNRRIRRISASPFTYTVGGYLVGLGSSKTVVLQNNLGNDLTLGSNGVFRFATALATATSYSVTIKTQPAGQTCTLAGGTGGFTTGNVFTVKINCAAVSTLAGQATGGYTDATGTAAQFRFNPVLTVDSTGIAVDASGNVYVADTFNNAIRKITSAGVVTTLAGSTAGLSGFVDATGTAARFFNPRGVAVDGSGNVYVGDTSNNAVRKITPAGVVSTFAGSTVGTFGYVDDVGTAARFRLPRGLAFDGAGNLYVADHDNNVIRVITPLGVVSTFAGNNGLPGNLSGTGTAARFNGPSGVAVDPSGNVYVADATSSTVRKITPAGVVTTLAGSPQTFTQPGYIDSTGTGAEVSGPGGVAVDAAGTVYVADYGTHHIRRINPAGTVTTLAGTGAAGYVDDNGAIAQFHLPGGIAVDSSGTLYVVDMFNNAVRKIAQ